MPNFLAASARFDVTFASVWRISSASTWAKDIPGRIEKVRSGLAEETSAEGKSSMPIVRLRATGTCHSHPRFGSRSGRHWFRPSDDRQFQELEAMPFRLLTPFNLG